jgi:hypothetical protein
MFSTYRCRYCEPRGKNHWPAAHPSLHRVLSLDRDADNPEPASFDDLSAWRAHLQNKGPRRLSRRGQKSRALTASPRMQAEQPYLIVTPRAVSESRQQGWWQEDAYLSPPILGRPARMGGKGHDTMERGFERLAAFFALELSGKGASNFTHVVPESAAASLPSCAPWQETSASRGSMAPTRVGARAPPNKLRENPTAVNRSG